MVSTLRRIVNALGEELEVSGRFPAKTVKIEPFNALGRGNAVSLSLMNTRMSREHARRVWRLFFALAREHHGPVWLSGGPRAATANW
jgi:hypothetical protein